MKTLLRFTVFTFFLGILANFSCKEEYPDLNDFKPPTANAGPDQMISLPKDSVVIDGRASSDPDGTIIKFQWTKISGPSVYNILNASATNTLIKNLQSGTYQVELTVTDNSGLFRKDTMKIVVNHPGQTNQPPVAVAGSNQIIYLPINLTTLDGSNSFDPENNIVGYQWTKVLGPTPFIIENYFTAKTRVTNLQVAIYQFELKVVDSFGLFSKDTVQITVNDEYLISPVADAGIDVSIGFDLQTCSMSPSSITLNGSAIADTGEQIVSYLWTGPGVISNPNGAITQVSNLSVGGNVFILKVTDNKGATDLDTLIINVVSLMNRPIVSAQLIPFGKLSRNSVVPVIATAGNKILFTGGYPTGNFPAANTVDIYDIVTEIWSTAQLSQGRWEVGVAVLGNKIFFAGGQIPVLINDTWFIPSESRSSTVDIYDASSNTWSIAQLSSPVAPVGASANNKVVFAGGDYWSPSSEVNIYDATTNAWTTARLSFARRVLAVSTIGNKIFFAGGDYPNDGLTSNIDIYNTTSNSWVVDYFSAPFDQGWAPTGIAVGNKNYWAGGWYYSLSTYVNPTNHVEIRDETNNSVTFACLFEPNSGFSAVVKNNKIVFFTNGGLIKNKFDIYDITTDTWSIGVMSQEIFNASIISVNNTIYVAGGYVNGVLSNQVWILEL